MQDELSAALTQHGLGGVLHAEVVAKKPRARALLWVSGIALSRSAQSPEEHVMGNKRVIRWAAASGCCVALVAVGAGCSPAGSPSASASSSGASVVASPSATASASPSASATASPSLSGDQAVLWARLQEYNDVMNKIMQDPKSDMTTLYTVARDQQAKDDVDAIASARAKGERRVGGWVMSDPRVDNSESGKATVTVCVDTMNVQMLDASGKDIAQHRRATQAYWFTQDPKTMAWYMTDAELKSRAC